MRISFTGDIMCELPTLRKAKSKNKYDFKGILSDSEIFEKTDYIVGNLETVLAGEKAKFSKDIYSYNTPDTFADEVFKAGFNLVSTANNHCLDRGKDGLIRTMETLKDKGIEYVGTNLNSCDKRYKIVDFGNLKIGFLSYTYGSNYSINKNKLDNDDIFLVNFFENQEWIDTSRKDLYSKLKDNLISAETRVKILKLLRRDFNRPRIDNNSLQQLNPNLAIDIQELKRETDFIILLMHSGGQFNKEPGVYTKELVKELDKLGVDMVIGNHPHVVQKTEYNSDFFVAYSLGNFFISPDTIYLINDNLPLYSIVLHMDIINNKNYKMSFSISKIIKKGKIEKVVDTFELYKEEGINKNKLVNDCKQIYETFTRKQDKDFSIRKEYELYMEK
ncbi:CapA family protein [Anaerococcus hydrogenalis]|uniref:Bacterial capsule synthesis protein n=1 Tax=Anaerococcus hydrogenalis ACS-025-V-Sch4 TaxID=879306 RepID=F0GYI8_9FIRM|nr:CapA family protein [Anaerococcus hydrogenalis]EGC84720.1 bacterial capsule synthesis protein [Anaerococcus hydrogenalis ACS-025-V-Sch4]